MSKIKRWELECSGELARQAGAPIPDDGEFVVLASDYDALAAELAEAKRVADDLRARIVSMTRQRDDNYDRWEIVWLERDALRAALERIESHKKDRHTPRDEYPEQLRIIAREALRGADDLPPNTATVTCRHGIETVRRTYCRDCEDEPLAGGKRLKEIVEKYADQPTAQRSEP